MPFYSAYGLVFKSELDLPEFSTSEKSVADVVIRFGTISDQLPDQTSTGPLFQLNPTQLRYALPGVAAYWVRNGSEIIVEPNAGTDESTIRLFLYHAVLAALFHQRKIIPLHASAVETPEGAAVFLGSVSSGKSTLVAGLMQHGYPFLSDDLTLIARHEDGRLNVFPAFPAIALWEDVLNGLGSHDLSTLRRVRPELQKYWLPVEAGSQKPVPVRAFYHLETIYHAPFSIEPVSPLHRIPMLTQNIHHLRFATDMGLMPGYWQTLAVGSRLPMSAICRNIHDGNVKLAINALLEEWSL